MNSFTLAALVTVPRNAQRLALAATVFFSATATAQSTPMQAAFAPPQPLLNRVGITTTDVVADFDGDGIPDVLKNAFGIDSLALFRGLGGGDFAYVDNVLALGDTLSVNQSGAGDLDGDGDVDLIASTSFSSSMRKLINDGSGHFSVEELGLSGGPWINGRLADLNGDGADDLVFTEATFGVPLLYWAERQGNQFSTSPLPLERLPGPLFDAVDLDGDGNLDITSFAPNGGLRVSFGLGGAAFAPFGPLPGPAGSAVTPVTILDINGDGYAEIFTARSNGLKYYRATGPRAYAAPVLLEPALDQNNSTELLDLDGDSDLDILHITSDSFNSAGNTPATTITFLQSAPGVFTPGPPSGAAITHFATVKDITGNGLGDLLFANDDGLQWQLAGAGGGAGYFGPVQAVDLGLNGADLHVLADLDADGDTDVVVAANGQLQLGWIENLGAGRFAQPLGLVDVLGPVAELRVIDADSDGDQDIVSLRRVNNSAIWDVALFANDGSGALSQVGTPITFTADQVVHFDVADLNADGDADLVLQRVRIGALWSLDLLLGDGLGMFSSIAGPIQPTTTYARARPADVNGDGLPDLTILKSSAALGQVVVVALNQGNGSFSLGQEQPLVNGADWLNIADLNQDGHLDAVTSNPGGMTLFPGDGTGSLQAGVFLVGTIASRPEFADLDADGDLDAYSAVTQAIRGTRWSEQLSPGVFAAEVNLYTDFTRHEEVSIFADVDGDGDLDAVVRNPVDFGGTQVRIHENVTFAPIGQSFCGAPTPNSTGQPGLLLGYGSEDTGRNAVELHSSGLPTNQTGLVVGSRTFSTPTPIPGSMGFLCLTGAIGRYNGPGQVQSSGATGSITLPLDLTTLALPSGPVAGLAGESWSFQLWHRDTIAGAATSNLTTGVVITLR